MDIVNQPRRAGKGMIWIVSPERVLKGNGVAREAILAAPIELRPAIIKEQLDAGNLVIWKERNP